MKGVSVDIVMATNRASPYLSAALASVQSQSYRQWRLIVVDDGSPDGRAIPAAVAGMPNTTVVRHDHRGLPASRNAGIACGNSPLIALIDDDDVWFDDKLESQVRALHDRPDALASFTAGRYIDARGDEFGTGWPAATVPSEWFISGLEPQPRIVSLVVRRSAHDLLGGFNESYSLAEDNEYILRLALHGPLVAVSEPLIRYRRHSHNMSSSGSLEGRQANLRIVGEMREAYGHNAAVSHLLTQRRTRLLDESSAESAREMAHALRHHDAAKLAAELRWAATTAPVRTARALAAKVAALR